MTFMRIFPKKPFCTIKTISSGTEEMGYNCTFYLLFLRKIPFSSERNFTVRTAYEKSDILSNIASKQISKIVPFSGWGSLDMKTI